MKRKLLYTLAFLFVTLQTFAQTTYTYDDLSRLTMVKYGNGVTVSYTYDALGNRLSKKVTGASNPKEAYAWMSSDGKTLTFCYDDKRAEREGNTFELEEDYHYPKWNSDPWNNPSQVSTVVFNPSFTEARPTNTSYWFCNFKHLIDIVGLQYLNTSKVTDMGGMIEGCSQLTTLDLRTFDTSKVTDMSWMFQGCESLKSINLSSFDTSNVTDMSSMFDYCRSLTTLDLRNFNTSKVRWFFQMFDGCSSLTNLDVSNFDTSSSTSMSTMFSGCSSLTTLDVSNFNTSNVIGMSQMFSSCRNLKSIDVSHFDTKKVESMSRMFNYCSSLTSLDVSNFDTSNVTESDMLFNQCNRLKSLYISSTMGNLNEEACSGVGSSTNPCTLIAPDGFDFGVDTSGHTFVWKSGTFSFDSQEAYAWMSSDGKTLTFCYDDKRANRNGETYDLNETNYYPDWNPDPWSTPCNVTAVVFEPSFAKARPLNTSSWFCNFKDLTVISGLENLNTSNVTNMYSMFRDCKLLKELNISHFDTSNVTMLWAMFSGCSSLESLDVRKFDTSKVTDMTLLFAWCYNLKKLVIGNFDTSNVTNMYMMFIGCRNLTSLDISSFNTSKVTNMQYMFDGCSGLTSLDVSNFDTSNVTTSNDIFDGCSGLKKLSISSTMGNISDNACNGVGTSSSPCTLIAPKSFDFGVDTSGEYFYWKGGCFKVSNSSGFASGDVNHDGSVNISDVVLMVSYILGETNPSFHLEEANVNGDNEVNITDIICVVNNILKNTSY